MTWAEFKTQVENQGVKDDWEIVWIDVDGYSEMVAKIHPNFKSSKTEIQFSLIRRRPHGNAS